MKIDMELVEYLEELSRLELSSGEKARAAAELEKIIGYMELLSELDLEGVEPLSHPFDADAELRPDAVELSTPRDALLSNAPRVKDGAFAVPKAVE